MQRVTALGEWDGGGRAGLRESVGQAEAVGVSDWVGTEGRGEICLSIDFSWFLLGRLEQSRMWVTDHDFSEIVRC